MLRFGGYLMQFYGKDCKTGLVKTVANLTNSSPSKKRFSNRPIRFPGSNLDSGEITGNVIGSARSKDLTAWARGLSPTSTTSSDAPRRWRARRPLASRVPCNRLLARIWKVGTRPKCAIGPAQKNNLQGNIWKKHNFLNKWLSTGRLDEACPVLAGHVILSALTGLGIWSGSILLCCCIGEFMGDWVPIPCWPGPVGGIPVMDPAPGYIDWPCHRNTNTLNIHRKGTKYRIYLCISWPFRA